MALKFLNKKGWHTGSLRNIENVWKAEQKHEAEKRKLEELKKQIHDEREAQEFRLLQEQAGLIPKQERLEFLYDSGLAVGRNASEEYLLGKPIEEKKGEDDVSKVAATPGSLFVEEKPPSANDAWRKLHTDPLLLIRQQEQAALARIRNNPVKMGLIKKTLEEKISKKDKRKKRDEKERKHKDKKRKKQHMDDPSTSRLKGPTDNKEVAMAEENMETSDYSKRSRRSEREEVRHSKRSSPEGKHSNLNRRHESPSRSVGNPERSVRSPERRGVRSPERRSLNSAQKNRYESPTRRRHRSRERREESPPQCHESVNRNGRFNNRHDTPEGSPARHHKSGSRNDRLNKRHDTPDSSDSERDKRKVPLSNGRDKYERTAHTGEGKLPAKQRRLLTDEERAARLKEMQEDAEVHEEQRWHRLKKAHDADKLEEARVHSNGQNFVSQTARSIYGADRGGSISVEESVRRRTHFIARSIGDGSTNTFVRN